MSLYVYAITKASHPLDLDDLKGVGEPPAELHVVRSGDLRAVVSETPEDLSMGRRDLEAHHEAQEQLWADGTTLPLGFGFVTPDEDSVRAVLEERAEAFSQRLDELTGRVEFNVKGIQDEDALLRTVLEESEQVRALNEAIRDGGGTYEDRLALGQLVAQEVQSRQAALAEEVLTALRPLVLSEKLAEPSQQYFVNASFLVEDEGSEDFTEAGRELAERFGDGVELRLRGPLPPYSFV
ncbi:gas vesicle protein [Streptomyces dysideae]|uniref:Gas vesicle protein n=2 Tax=Streptomyces dysideae TaxID=909626 RepID=A0A101V215_9ACTN|nr:gas vesicle protein [Streptomyces dysideae]